MKTPRLAPVLSALVVLVGFAGCTSSKEIVGTWTLEQLEASVGNPPLPPPGRTRPTVNFEAPDSRGEGKVTGFGGVNRFFGNYNVSAGTIAIGSLGATRMAGPTELMTMEKIFLGVLQSAREWKVEKSTLEVTGGSGRATFARAEGEGEERN